MFCVLTLTFPTVNMNTYPMIHLGFTCYVWCYIIMFTTPHSEGGRVVRMQRSTTKVVLFSIVSVCVLGCWSVCLSTR